MWSWKSKESKAFALTIASLFFLNLPLATSAQAEEPKGNIEESVEAPDTSDIRVTLIDIDQFTSYQEIKTAFLKSENIQKVSLVSEAPGLVQLSVRTHGSNDSHSSIDKLIENLNVLLSEKFRIKEKKSSNYRGEEIIIYGR